MAGHCANAESIARFLAEQLGIARVHYPFREAHPQHALARAQTSAGGGVVAFEIDGGKEPAFRFCNALLLIDISNNLGDAKSLMTHPATTTHQRLAPEARAALGITEGMLRHSAGLEDPSDICDDITRALASV